MWEASCLSATPLPPTPVLILPKAQSGGLAEGQAQGLGKTPGVWLEPCGHRSGWGEHWVKQKAPSRSPNPDPLTHAPLSGSHSYIPVRLSLAAAPPNMAPPHSSLRAQLCTPTSPSSSAPRDPLHGGLAGLHHPSAPAQPEGTSESHWLGSTPPLFRHLPHHHHSPLSPGLCTCRRPLGAPFLTPAIPPGTSSSRKPSCPPFTPRFPENSASAKRKHQHWGFI